MTSDHEDCFKREHDISAAWARAEDEVKALKLRLHQLEQRVSPATEPCSCPEFCTYHARSNFDGMKLQIETWKKYHALLIEELNSAVGMAWIHGWRSTDEKIARGKELRKLLGISEIKCPDCPPEKDCMKWNGCSCGCHRRDKSRKPRPDMIWSDKYEMWLDPDNRSPERKARDEKIAEEAEKRALGEL